MTKMNDKKPSDAEIANLIARVEFERSRPVGDTLERQEARQESIRAALRQLDLAIWQSRKRGETVNQVRARLAPSVMW